MARDQSRGTLIRLPTTHSECLDCVGLLALHIRQRVQKVLDLVLRELRGFKPFDLVLAAESEHQRSAFIESGLVTLRHFHIRFDPRDRQAPNVRTAFCAFSCPKSVVFELRRFLSFACSSCSLASCLWLSDRRAS